MGWPEEIALHCDINYIRLAHAGRINMLKAIFGSGEEEPKPFHNEPPVGGGGKVIKMTPRAFDTVFNSSKGPK